MSEGMDADMMFKVSTPIKPFDPYIVVKNTLRDGDSNELYTVDTIQTVESALHTLLKEQHVCIYKLSERYWNGLMGF